jgi:sulfopyruvate decarboxylase subunit alpha
MRQEDALVVSASEFCSMLKGHGFDFFTGVPCTILKDIIICLSSDPEVPYIPATREDEAIGIATGACLAGRRPLVLMQNSGLGSSINPLASLDMLYKIPLLMLIGWRGYEGKDAPEHLIMGEATVRLLEALGVAVQVISEDDPEKAIAASVESMRETGIPAAALLRKGIVG